MSTRGCVGMDLRRFFLLDACPPDEEGLSETTVEEDLLAGVVHDLSNRLVPVRLLVEGLRSDPSISPSALDRVGMIEESLELTLALTKKLLSYAGPEGATPIRIDVAGLLADVRRLVRLVGVSKEPDVHLGEETQWVLAEPRMALHLLLVVTKAAYDVLTLGGREGEVRISTNETQALGGVSFNFDAVVPGAEVENGSTKDWDTAFDELCKQGCGNSVIPLSLGAGPSELATLADAVGGTFRATALSQDRFRLAICLPG